MQFINKIPVKKRPFRGIKKRIAGKTMCYGLDVENESVLILDLKVGDVCSDHGANYRVSEIRKVWRKVLVNRRKHGCAGRAYGSKKGRFLETTIVFSDGSYPCGCSYLQPPVDPQTSIDEGLLSWLECSFDDLMKNVDEWWGASLTDQKREQIVAAWKEGQEIVQNFRSSNDLSVIFYDDGVVREEIKKITNRLLNGDS